MPIALKPGEHLTVVAVAQDLKPTHPIVLPPGEPTHPIYIPPAPAPGDPKPTHPIYIAPPVPTHPIVIPPPIDPPTQPPPDSGGTWVWAWAPGLERWVWVRVPGAGEAGPKK
jgi:hypothetical protein